MFSNEPFANFSDEKIRTAFLEALSALERKVASEEVMATPLINGTPISTTTSLISLDPSNASRLGKVSLASSKDAEIALKELSEASDSWRATSVCERATILRNAANIMREKKIELCALLIREVGKTWAEADGDVAEAIDFCNFYADESERIMQIHDTASFTGERNFYFYEPRGIASIITPWNFPLAIACGMTVAALVTGNCVALKPAEQSSLIASEMVKILFESGLPRNVLAFLPGNGEEVGRTLVSSPLTDIVGFTGSKAVGLEIIERSAEVRPGQRNIKRVVSEMGGKNAIIVDDDADVDEAVKGIIASTFGFAGQKCSACSRLIVLETLYERVLARLKEAASDLIVGCPGDPSTFLGPVIDEASQSKLLSIINSAQQRLTLLFQGERPNKGYYVPHTIFRDVPLNDLIWTNELFGPVLACAKVKSFDEAIAVAMDSEYALTGGVYSRNPNHLDKALANFRVGNLYINRKCTGAMVSRQPFGGSKMSGVGSKAGGTDYLLQFLEPRTVTENTFRSGFAPEIEI